MDVLRIAAWVVGLGAFGGLIVASHRQSSRGLRLGLTLISSALLIYVLTDQPAALLLFGLNIVLVFGTWHIGRTPFWWGWIVLLVALLILSKLPGIRGTDTFSAHPGRISAAAWLGFSYLAFRLIHLTVEAHAGRLADVSLEEAMIYALHPASLIAGPIDRVRTSMISQREATSLTDDLHQGLWRILVGTFTKFVIANALYSFIAVHDMAQNPDQPTGIAWLWLFAYSFYLLADFAAYTNIAIGFGRLAGLRLPENFDRPYLSPSIALFWQRWHITLSNWVRDYIFFPLARALRSKAGNRYRVLIQLLCHLVTMGVVGLWHGLSTGFLVWGIWHGLGLFVYGQISARAPRPTPAGIFPTRLRSAIGIALTYGFVTLGWVFFAADLPTAIRIIARLFGLNG